MRNTRTWRRATSAVAAGALLAAVGTSVVASPAGAVPSVVIDEGHVDGMDVQAEDGELVLRVHDGSVEPAQDRDPADVLLHVDPDAEFVVPAGLPPSFAFVGEPGDVVWMLPEIQMENPDVVWLGWASERLTAGVVQGSMTLRMVDVEGPGDVGIWQSSVFGEPVNQWGSLDGWADSVNLNQNAHVHASWLFTAPGAYTITFQVDGTAAGSGDAISTGPVDYHFHVGELPDPPAEPTFADVGVDHPFFEDIEWMAAEGISEGYAGSPKPTYRPSAAVTRQAMSAFMYRLAGEPAFSAPGAATFADVSVAHPFFDEVEWMAAEGISEGYAGSPKPTYRPSAAVTRQAMSAFMYRLAGEPAFSAPGAATFADVSVAHPFFDEVEWMAAEGISEGYAGSPKPTYRPSAAVTRQAMSAFMHRLADGPGVAG